MIEVTERIDVQFNLEQSIMSLWGVTEDFKILKHAIEKKEMPSEHIAELVQGFIHSYQIKGEQCFEHFESFLKLSKISKNAPNFDDEMMLEENRSGG